MSAVSVYCERLAPGLLGEPLNTLTNLAFLCAAFHGWRQAGKHHDQRLLAALLGAIGVGSALFHAFATPLTQLFDVIPIALFQLCYLGLYLRRVTRCTPAACAACLLLYVVMLTIASQWSAPLNGSLAYSPAAVALLLLGIVHWRMRASADVLGAALLFMLLLPAVLCDRPKWWPVSCTITAAISSSVSVSGRGSPRNAQADAMAASGVDKYDIPAFLRRQSD